ncbi:DUF1499 domain-containing protein [Photobacterium chitinilyticum]|uniref:DUF1499 domain-containing protein n=1 Tax=Photobacterium chitinilyticum TaxID=2485123 RepID=A0A444JTT0_9GAMM|nr:DUF1499 domain-containing protein [Photobacterium chitinilyticum]RWX56500.1 DUF1499 domain-containing protein [Photobacterium chitinilyticum]
MIKPLLLLLPSLVLLGCSNADTEALVLPDRTVDMCGEKPNCVSTIEPRGDFSLAAFKLNQQGLSQWLAIKDIALSLPGASLGQQSNHYIRVECRSKIFGFVDDFEIKLQGDELIVRSESRTGYSDFGVNRERAEQFRQLLAAEEYLQN